MVRLPPFVVPTLLAVSMLALLLRLGFWQLDRARYKESLLTREQVAQALPALEIRGLADIDGADDSYFRQASIPGRFDSERQYLLDNRTHDGRAGFHVLTALRISDGVVLVNRGWVALGATRSELPMMAPLPSGEVVVRGRLSPPPGSGLLLGDSGHEGAVHWPRIVQTVDTDAMSAALDAPIAPHILLLDASDAGCHVCNWQPVRGIGPEKHRGYAVQWFALALALVVLCALLLRGRRAHAR